jgi:hypothetical protein
MSRFDIVQIDATDKVKSLTGFSTFSEAMTAFEALKNDEYSLALFSTGYDLSFNMLKFWRKQ